MANKDVLNEIQSVTVPLENTLKALVNNNSSGKGEAAQKSLSAIQTFHAEALAITAGLAHTHSPAAPRMGRGGSNESDDRSKNGHNK